jgi:hypothetical protein
MPYGDKRIINSNPNIKRNIEIKKKVIEYNTLSRNLKIVFIKILSKISYINYIT